ncbi:ABC transporter permease [Micromonospora halotolerans]|uniref:Transport permease protein n=1 Tax=Micromonospora halotolerans TaxID=709879 RepID=A0ABY9ZU78_9ACTN|nr:ABC transporter permease [Micromonospora halotolerans]WNM38693.1 ABC transporter permease [Micromonospora halotolerans]
MTVLPLSRARWAAADTAVLTRRTLAHWARRPGEVVFGLLFPVLLLLMFGYLFGGAMALPAGGAATASDGADYREFLLPGMVAMTMLFGVESTYTAVAVDTARGVTDRFRSLPMSRAAVVTGRAVADLLHSAVALAVVLGCGALVGWQPHRGPLAALAAVALLLLLRFAMIWLGVYLALLLRRPETVAVLQILVWPLGFASNAFVAPATMPGWLAAVAAWNPLSATVAATRDLFGNPGWGAGSWPTEHAVALAVLWPLLLVAVFLPLSVRRWQRLGR